jgi:hypothetical protein
MASGFLVIEPEAPDIPRPASYVTLATGAHDGLSALCGSNFLCALVQHQWDRIFLGPIKEGNRNANRHSEIFR